MSDIFKLFRIVGCDVSIDHVIKYHYVPMYDKDDLKFSDFFEGCNMLGIFDEDRNKDTVMYDFLETENIFLGFGYCDG